MMEPTAWGRVPTGGRSDKARKDVYLFDPQADDLGVKEREGKAGLEIKALVDPTFAERSRRPWPF